MFHLSISRMFWSFFISFKIWPQNQLFRSSGLCNLQRPSFDGILKKSSQQVWEQKWEKYVISEEKFIWNHLLRNVHSKWFPSSLHRAFGINNWNYLNMTYTLSLISVSFYFHSPSDSFSDFLLTLSLIFQLFFFQFPPHLHQSWLLECGWQLVRGFYVCGVALQKKYIHFSNVVVLFIFHWDLAAKPIISHLRFLQFAILWAGM